MPTGPGSADPFRDSTPSASLAEVPPRWLVSVAVEAKAEVVASGAGAVGDSPAGRPRQEARLKGR
jgi:hypothetical protein